MKCVSRMAVVLAMCLGISGCGLIMHQQSRATNDKLMNIQVGMGRQQVLDLLGNPYRREMYGPDEFLIYETDHFAVDEGARYTPILVRDGKVAGWGRNFYDTALKSKIDADVTVRQK
jgi:hypothetical protein